MTWEDEGKLETGEINSVSGIFFICLVIFLIQIDDKNLVKNEILKTFDDSTLSSLDLRISLNSCSGAALFLDSTSPNISNIKLEDEDEILQSVNDPVVAELLPNLSRSALPSQSISNASNNHNRKRLNFHSLFNDNNNTLRKSPRFSRNTNATFNPNLRFIIKFF